MFSKRNNEKQIHSQLNAFSNIRSNMIKKAAVSILLISCFSFNMAFAKENESNSLNEIYHIYLNGEYVGALSNKDEMQLLIDQKLKESSEQYKDIALNAGSNISVVQEQVFTSSTNDEETLKKLNKLLEIEATAFALSVNDQMKVYVKDLESYRDVINKLKLHFVSQEELDALEVSNDNHKPLPHLAVGQTRIADLVFKEKISGVTVEVNPNKIVSSDDALKLLLTGTLEQEKYKVKAGDVLGTIASKYNITTAELMKINAGITDSTVLQIGKELNVTVLKPIINVEVHYEKRIAEEIKHTKTVIETDKMFKGDTKVKQEGSDGKKVSTYLVRKENGIQVGQSILEETIIAEPKEHIVLKGTKVIPSRGSGVFAWPAEGGYISSQMGYRWGRKHEGIDIARPSGFTIKATDNGIVEAAGWDGTYGQRVIVNHQNGYKTTYAHLSAISVSVGDVVSQGSKLGKMGSTGRSTGTHLHFEVEKNGVTINPLSVLK